MAIEYKVIFEGNEIVYGPLITRSHFSEEEWLAVYTELVKQGNPEAYRDYKGDDYVIASIGALIDLEERYEALLELLPQDSYSKSGTHPQWVADAVEDNTLDKFITQDDVEMFIKDYEDIDDLKAQLVDYFKIELDKS